VTTVDRYRLAEMGSPELGKGSEPMGVAVIESGFDDVSTSGPLPQGRRHPGHLGADLGGERFGFGSELRPDAIQDSTGLRHRDSLQGDAQLGPGGVGVSVASERQSSHLLKRHRVGVLGLVVALINLVLGLIVVLVVTAPGTPGVQGPQCRASPAGGQALTSGDALEAGTKGPLAPRRLQLGLYSCVVDQTLRVYEGDHMEVQMEPVAV
jgi:hypothetical protein